MASVRQAAQCIGVSGEVSIIRDFYGYRTGAPKQLSLLTQVRLLQVKHIHLNLIRTAFLNDSVLKQIDVALQFMRDTYATVDIGVGRVKRFVVPQGGFEIIMDDAVALDLFESFSAPGDGIDVFLVIAIAGLPMGGSPTDGSCDKDDKDSGVAIGVFDSGTSLGITFAHETGHFLGLDHDGDPANLMFDSAPNGGKLNSGQGGVMKQHCSMRAGCQI